jgi:predicted enzyme related to lactoylglutathione lyase
MAEVENGTGPMHISYVFAGAMVSNRDEAAAWYERLLGRSPDFLPNEAEAVWQIAETASVYLLADPARAGQGVMALVVEDMGLTLRAIEARGIETGQIEEIPGAGRKCVIIDPDGNAVSILEINAASDN